MKKPFGLSEEDKKLLADLIRRERAEQSEGPNTRPPRRHAWAAKLRVAKVPFDQVLCAGTALVPGVLRCEMYRLANFQDDTALSTQCAWTPNAVGEYVQMIKNGEVDPPVYWTPRVFNVSDVDIIRDDGYFPVIKTETGHWIAAFAPYRSKWAKTKTGGIASNSFADVVLEKTTGAAPYWTADTRELRAYNRGAAIPANVLVLLLKIDGRWCAFEVC